MFRQRNAHISSNDQMMKQQADPHNGSNELPKYRIVVDVRTAAVRVARRELSEAEHARVNYCTAHNVGQHCAGTCYVSIVLYLLVVNWIITGGLSNNLRVT